MTVYLKAAFHKSMANLKNERIYISCIWNFEYEMWKSLSAVNEWIVKEKKK